jgi:hypothetical protein
MQDNHERSSQQGRGVPGIGHTLACWGVGRLDQPNFSLAVFALRAALGQITAAMNGSAALCGLPALPPSCCGWHDRSVRRGRREWRGFACACHAG